MKSATIVVKDSLRELLQKRFIDKEEIPYEVSRIVPVKDVIESLGIPHTEVGLITSNGQCVDFSYVLKRGDYIEVFPHELPIDVFKPTPLRQEVLDEIRFIVDVNVARLAGLLRLFGFDVYYDRSISDEEIAEISHREKRILLTRDKGLLKRKIVTFGRLIRESEPYKQFHEVCEVFDLTRHKNPFSRCMLCNAILVEVDKDVVSSRLEPLTVRYYDKFLICTGCRKIYWEGSHVENMDLQFRSLNIEMLD